MIPWLMKLGRGFKYAFSGLAWIIITQRHARIHLLASLAVAVLGTWFGISGTEWCMVVLACGMVFAAEAMNSAIEKLADRITTEKDEFIRVSKDVAAAGVLVSAIAALIVGLIIFLPHVLERL